MVFYLVLKLGGASFWHLFFSFNSAIILSNCLLSSWMISWASKMLSAFSIIFSTRGVQISDLINIVRSISISAGHQNFFSDFFSNIILQKACTNVIST